MTKKRLFFDIETSFNVGIFWRAGYNQTIRPEDIIHERAIICVCWKWEEEDEVNELHWDNKQSDKKLLEKFIQEINKADEIVAHNGDRFDLKWLRTRCLFHRLPMFPSYQTIDTLKIAKKQFNFNSNKLDYIAKFLGLEGKLEHKGLSMWKKIVFEKDTEALNTMIDYCKKDVLVLEEVYNTIKNYSTPKVNYAVLRGGDKYECPECSGTHVSVNKTYTTSMGTIKHSMRCLNRKCGTAYNINNKTYMELLKFRAMNNIK